MSNVRIALQPPPNVDFVVGYPGIPPGARDRPQAAVKGAVEVRVGPAGAKAKWVRVELKKIETLPGGGQANSYFDHVGPSPISLWQSSEDYSVLQSQDLPFLIRIPESIPPSIALERGAGIRYELVATVCTLGQKSFFRRRKTAVVSQATTIIIDKHELHSTWPVYSQPESRSVHQDGIHLTVERGRTCYGPGDRVSIMAILKSDAVHPVTLRGFEFTLKETTIFRASPQASSKRSSPQVKVANIGEQKVPLSVTVFNGNHHKAELGCLIPNTHTTTTLNAARHVDITYVIVVRAWIGSMQSVTMELPVIVSNWPRNVSEEAVRRIGYAPSLCVTSPSSPAATVPITTPSIRPVTADSYLQNPINRLSDVNEFGVNSHSPLAQPKRYNTVPTGLNGSANLDGSELGLVTGSGARAAGTVDHPGFGSSTRPGSRGGLGGIQEDAVLGGAEGSPSVAEPRTVGGRRRGSANAHPQNRLTITNISEKDAEDGITPQTIRAGRPTTPTRAGQKPWPTAANEKQMLYEKAVERVKVVQGAAAMANDPAASDAPTGSTSAPTPSKKPPTRWPSAHNEKERLYEEAQKTAKRTQAYGVSSPSLHSRTSSEANSPPPRDKPIPSGAAIGPAVSTGEALYQHAVSSISSKSNNGPNSGVPNSRGTPPSPPSSVPRVPYYPTAEEEKAALKRYHEAKLAVDRNQYTHFSSREGSSSAPVSYDVLYPQGDGPSQAGGSDTPPPFDVGGSGGRPSYLNEKERLRRQFEAQDAAALASQAQTQTPVPIQDSPTYTAEAPAYAGPPIPDENAGLSEKEILRRRLDEQERVALLLQQQQQQQQSRLQQQQVDLDSPILSQTPTPPHINQQQQQSRLQQRQVDLDSPILSQTPTPPRINGARAPPVPPMLNGFKPLTAAEEKAQLRAKYAAEERGQANGHAHDTFSTSQLASEPTPAPRHPYATATPRAETPSPPPLLPRPPAEYIQETQEVDVFGRRYYDHLDDAGPSASSTGMLAHSSSSRRMPGSNSRLDMRPFSPFDNDGRLGYDGRGKVMRIVSPTPVHGVRSPPPPSVPPAGQY